MRALVITTAIVFGSLSASAEMLGRWKGDVEGIFDFPSSIGSGSCDLGQVEIRSKGSKAIEVYVALSCAVEGKPGFNMIPVAEVFTIKGDKLFTKEGHEVGELGEDFLHLKAEGENYLEETTLTLTEKGLNYEFRFLDSLQNTVDAVGLLKAEN
ncbi:MAG: hypothetical protein ABL958_03580 [Bdellovibrionia bacterium]